MEIELTKDSVNLNADTEPAFKKRCQRQIATEHNWNSSVPIDDISISAKTVHRYIKERCFLERDAQIKNSARKEAYLNIRNSISCASVLTSLERLLLDLEGFYSGDDVSFLLSGMNNKKVLVILLIILVFYL